MKRYAVELTEKDIEDLNSDFEITMYYEGDDGEDVEVRISKVTKEEQTDDD